MLTRPICDCDGWKNIKEDNPSILEAAKFLTFCPYCGKRLSVELQIMGVGVAFHYEGEAYTERPTFHSVETFVAEIMPEIKRQLKPEEY